MLLVVRHAAPAVSPDAAPSEWPLSEEGRAGAAVLADRLAPLVDRRAAVVSSPEPKAAQTVSALSEMLATRGSMDGSSRSEVVLDDRLGEVRRPREPTGESWRARRFRYVAGEDLPGWELRQDVARRFDAAVREHVAAADGAPVVVGSHGMVITCWLVAQGLVREGTAGQFWSALRLPDAFDVDLAAGRVDRAG